MTHQRVLHFIPSFESHDEALGFALAQAAAWIGERSVDHSQIHAE